MADGRRLVDWEYEWKFAINRLAHKDTVLAEQRARIAELEAALRAILTADQHGQGVLYGEAMERAARLLAQAM